MASKEADPLYPVPSYDEAIIRLLNSIAAEEEAYSRLIRAESEETTAFVGKRLDFPTNPSASDMIRYNQTLNRLLDSIVMSKWLLMKKLDVILHHRSEAAVELDSKYSELDGIGDPDMED